MLYWLYKEGGEKNKKRVDFLPINCYIIIKCK